PYSGSNPLGAFPACGRIAAVSREAQRAKNEALFRNLNERLKELDDRLVTTSIGAPARDPEVFFCACGHLDSMASVPMTRARDAAVRPHSELFVVLPEHVLSDIERVVEEYERFVVVEKLPGVPAAVARATDPRP